jgi:hypothetical protein
MHLMQFDLKLAAVEMERDTLAKDLHAKELVAHTQSRRIAQLTVCHSQPSYLVLRPTCGRHQHVFVCVLNA